MHAEKTLESASFDIYARRWFCPLRDVKGDSMAAIGARHSAARLTPLMLAMLVVSVPLEAAGPMDATTSDAARREAEQAIPWRELDVHQRRLVQHVVRNTSIYRRLPTRVFPCDPEVFTFLAQHPEVVVDTWNVLGISKLALDRASAEEFRVVDGMGSTGSLKYLYAHWSPDARNLAVAYAEGTYDGKPLTRPVKAQCLLLLRSGSTVETDGRSFVTARLDTFIYIDRAGVELVAKTIQPILGATADHNFVETMKFTGNVSRTAQQNPAGMERLAGQLPKIDAATRNELIAVCRRAAERHATLQQHRQAAGSPQVRPVSLIESAAR